jgi:hypothetical protein
VVEGGPRGAFDLPVARPFVRILAPRRGEIVADPEALDLPRPDQIRPARPPRAPRARKGDPQVSRPRPAIVDPDLPPSGAVDAPTSLPADPAIAAD